MYVELNGESQTTCLLVSETSRSLQNTWEEVNSTENYQKKWDVIFTYVVVIYKVVLYGKYEGVVFIEVQSLFLIIFDFGVYSVW